MKKKKKDQIPPPIKKNHSPIKKNYWPIITVLKPINQ